MRTDRHGVRWTPEGVELDVWAPFLQELKVRVGGDAGVEVPMRRDPEGFFSAKLDAREGDLYQLILPDGSARPDPASLRQPEGVHGPSALFRPEKYPWRESQWRGLPLEELVFYELHVGTFTPEGTLASAERRLPELAELGVRCIELMPLQPFSGPRNWGYDGVLLHAIHESYGGPQALQHFVDAAHAHGLAVCLDVVFNHLGPEGNHLTEFGPYFTSKHRSPWGDGLNFDGPESGPVRSYMIQAAVQWVRDFRVDVLRLDAVHAIKDDSQVHLVAELSQAVQEVAAASGRQIQVVAESDLNDRKVVEPPPQGWGASAMWADDFHHSLHVLLTGEKEAFFADYGEVEHLRRALAEGFVYQGEHSRFRQRPYGTSTTGLKPRQFVFCSQNHDQVGNRPHGERLSQLVPNEGLPAVATLVILGSGLPLLFMGEEYGAEEPFLYFTSHRDPALGKAVSEGRRAELIAKGVSDPPDPQEEETFRRSQLQHRRDGFHGELREKYKELLALRRRHAKVLGEEWPEVTVKDTVVTLKRSVLRVEINLSRHAVAGFEPWGVRIEETRPREMTSPAPSSAMQAGA